MTTPETTAILPLFERWPRLQNRLSRVDLGDFPTPVQKLSAFGDVGVEQLFIKRDDLSANEYGGNKVRKLEFLLGAALQRGAREVVTVGFAGSNHALATAICARQVGLRSTSLLLPQTNANYVRQNLLAGFAVGADLRGYRNGLALRAGLLGVIARGAMRGALPAMIPAGGSCPLGIVGYVNAAIELADQVEAGELPSPDRIYVPLGSMGTAIGLAIGLRAAGLATEVAAVRVIEDKMASEGRMREMFAQSCQLLRRHAPNFPVPDWSASRLTVRNGFLGEGYARFTQGGARAARLMQERAGITLNGTYSAKAAAAMLADGEKGEMRDKVVLYWNTYNSRDLSVMTDGVDYRHLPPVFHRYSEQDVQPLDKSSDTAAIRR